MIDISVNNAAIGFGGKEVLTNVSFELQAGDHAGLLGSNGTGKTTLFKIISGELKPDKGEVRLAPGKTIGILSQIPVYPDKFTVADVLDEAFEPFRALQSEIDDLASRMAFDESLIKPYGELTNRFETLGGYETGLLLSRVRQGLSIDNMLYEKRFNSLSGGEQTRVNLARLMLRNTDILLLDEPTNHLDMRACEWLEDYIDAYKGTVLVISHDRYFLDNSIKRVIELENGESTLYTGNFSAYITEKRRIYEETLKKYEHEQREIERLQAVARRMHDYAGKSAKLHRRAFAIEKRAARIQTVDKPARAEELRQKFKTRGFQADDALRLIDIEKRFGDQVILKKTTLTVRPGERIALLGDNGTGKTTLLKIIAGEAPPDSGRALPGPAAKMAALPQIVSFDHPERSLYDTMIYEAGCTPQEARNRLGGFNFRGEDVFQTVGTLSGGERSRLKLCILMGEQVNFLLLDEPTNHLDIASREWMEEAVEAFDQTLLFISHDRYFIARFATRIWMLENGRITDFHGTYEEYRQFRELEREERAVPPPKPGKQSKPQKAKDAKASERQKRVVERELELLETREREIEEEMLTFASDAGKLHELMEEKERVSERWNRLYAEWES